MGLSHQKTMPEMIKPLYKTMKIFSRSWGTLKRYCKKECMRELSSTFKTKCSLQEYQEDECKSLINTQ